MDVQPVVVTTTMVIHFTSFQKAEKEGHGHNSLLRRTGKCGSQERSVQCIHREAVPQPGVNMPVVKSLGHSSHFKCISM